jgi:NAD+ kinase
VNFLSTPCAEIDATGFSQIKQVPNTSSRRTRHHPLFATFLYNLRLLMAPNLSSGQQRRAAIVSKPGKAELRRIVPDIYAWFKANNYEIVIDPETAVYANGPELVERNQIASRNPDFVLVLGGDGTLLSAARNVAGAGIPVLGINLGSLGFLTEVAVGDLYPALEAVRDGRCTVEPRSLVHCEVIRSEQRVATYNALNDVIMSKAAIARLVNFDLYVDQDFVTNYKADALIVATPTGSTAYSLSAGGPILMPNLDGFVITPVSPHALTHRPVVVRDSAEIVIEVKTAEEAAYLSIDGQVGMPSVDGDRIVCRKSDCIVKLLHLEKTFFDVLNTKLKWGQR